MSRLVSVLATISPETASKPICNLCHERRFVVPCFSTSHSPGPFSFRPVLSTINCRAQHDGASTSARSLFELAGRAWNDRELQARSPADE